MYSQLQDPNPNTDQSPRTPNTPQTPNSPFQKPSCAPALKNYTLGKTIGQGSFGKVKSAIHDPSQIQVAIKIISKQKIQQLDMGLKVEREINIMQMFDHPHVIKLYEVINTPTDIYLVMELAQNGELFNYIVQRKKIDEKEALRYFQQLMAAVDYLHRTVQISHRDLKSENTMINKFDNLKVTDFGLSNVMLEGDFLKTSCGSPNYAAPEVISGQQYLGQPADIWSSGCLLYTLLVGKLPFDDPFVPTLFRKIRNGEYVIPDTVNSGAAELIRGMLCVPVDKRFTLQQVVNHPWFQQELPDHLAHQFENGYENTFGLIDESRVLTKTNGFMGSHLTMTEMRDLLNGEKTRNEIAICYKLVYDYEYEQALQLFYSQGKKLTEQERSDITKLVNVDAIDPITLMEHDFAGVQYDTFAKQSGQPDVLTPEMARKAFFFGIRLCPVSELLPSDMMCRLLNELKQLGYKWRLGGIVAYKFYDEQKKRDNLTLKLEGNKSKNPFQFSLKLQRPKNYLEYELIIGCCVYVAVDQTNNQQYILDMRRVTGEITMFLFQASRIADALLTITTKK